MPSTSGTSLGEDKIGARAKILNAKVARRANIPPGPKAGGILVWLSDILMHSCVHEALQIVVPIRQRN